MLLVIGGKIYIKIYDKHKNIFNSLEEELYYLLHDLLLNCSDEIDKICVNQFLFELTNNNKYIKIFDEKLLNDNRYLIDLIYWFKSVDIDMFHFCQQPNRKDIELSDYMGYTEWYQNLLKIICKLKSKCILFDFV